MLTFSDAKSLLAAHGQEHVLAFWSSLDESGRERLLAQIEAIGWSRFDRLVAESVVGIPEHPIPSGLRPAPYHPLVPASEPDEALYQRARRRGVELLSTGGIAAFTVSGGQGTRLGFDAPKGTFPVSPIQEKSLFQLFAESIARVQEKYGQPVLWVIMTSPMNHDATQRFFAEHRHFGLDPSHLLFHPQGTMPAFSPDGKLLLAAKDSLALSPDGHGGSLSMLRRSGALKRMAAAGIDHISYWQVDNPLVQPFDPLFIGLHDLTGSEMSCRSLTKTGPFEKLGNFCQHQGRIMVVEYSDMPENLATATDDSGRLAFREGSPAMHLLTRAFVEKMTAGDSLSLPFHRAEKKVPCVLPNGDRCQPDSPNGVKLETFIFDALPLADNVLILEAERDETFAPVKNPTGVDSVESCRELMVRRAARWLAKAGIEVPCKPDGAPDCVVELSPRSFLDADDVVAKAAQLRAPARGAREYYA